MVNFMKDNDIEDKNILITGGGGFIGSHLAYNLVNKNQVTVCDLSVHEKSYLNKFRDHKNLRVVIGDLLDSDHVMSIGDSYDCIIHSAGVLGVQNVISNPINSIEGNFLSTRNILNFSRKQTKLKKFLFFSTSEVYGNNCLNASENDTHVIDTVGIRGNYACSKSLCEFLVKAHQQTYGLDWICIRPFNVYGPYRYSPYALLSFIKNALQDKEIMINNTGEQIRSWCYISDFCLGVLSALKLDQVKNEAFNIGNDRTQISITNLVEKIKLLSNSKSTIKYGIDNLKEEIMFRSPSINKARGILGYNPTTGLDVGLQNTINWVESDML